MKLTRAFSLVIAMAIAPTALAGSNAKNDDTAAIKQKLSDTLNVDVISLKASPIAGLYEALTNRGVLYISKDGSKLLHGNLYDLNKGMKNLTEAAMAGPRIDMLKPLEKTCWFIKLTMKNMSLPCLLMSIVVTAVNCTIKWMNITILALQLGILPSHAQGSPQPMLMKWNQYGALPIRYKP